MPAPDIDAMLLSPEYVASPYRTYDLLRSQHPAYWSERWSAWLLTRHHDVVAVSNDYRRFSNRNRYTLYMAQFPADEQRQLDYLIGHYERGGLVQADPPDHTRLKRLMTMAFTPRAVARMRELVIEIVDELLDEMAERGHAELIRDFAFLRCRPSSSPACWASPRRSGISSRSGPRTSSASSAAASPISRTRSRRRRAGKT